MLWPKVLGYKNYKDCEKDMPRFLKPIAARLGITDPRPTDEVIINTMAKLNTQEIARCFAQDKGQDEKHPFSGKTVVLTGTLSGLTRGEAEEQIRAVGGQVGSTISKNTHFLVVGEKAGSKLDKARQLGIPTLTEEEFLRQLKR